MNSAIIATILFALETAIKVAPNLVVQLRELFTKDEITPADWEALRTKIASKSYHDYVPDSKIPKMPDSQ